jgi:predicted outer membrane protein
MLTSRSVPTARQIVKTMLAAAAFAAVTGTLHAQGSMVVPPQSTSRPMTAHASADSAQALVNFLTTVNRDEAMLARLALGKTARADVRAYAERVRDDHSNTLKAWAQKVPALSLTIPDSISPAPTRPAQAAGSAAMVNGVSEVRDTATEARGGMASAAIHSANVAAMAKLEQLAPAQFDSAYLTSELAGHDAILKELEKHPTTYTELQTLLTEFRSMIQDHRSAARKLRGDGD